MNSKPAESDVKQQVRQFYDQVGWQSAGEGLYQNARYEDLRPVSHEYIRRCHLRVARYLRPQGRFLLDAGSGPVQYPEYLAYSQGYAYRVCADLSIVALQEARKRLGARGLYVVADVAHLPFRPEAFEGVVSLHTFHHLPAGDQAPAYTELYRVLAPASSAVVVNGWTDSPLMRRLGFWVTFMEKLPVWLKRALGRRQPAEQPAPARGKAQPVGTFVQKMDATWLKSQLAGRMDFEIRVWRSVSVRFLRAVIRPYLAGRLWLRLLYGLEERFPRYFGENGQYPLIVIRKA